MNAPAKNAPENTPENKLENASGSMQASAQKNARSSVSKNAPAVQKPPRWQDTEQALRAVQVAFDVEEAVMEAIRVAAFHGNVSTSTQIRQVLGLPVPARPKRPRLTVTLSESDYALLARRYGLRPDDRMGIKQQATRELMGFAQLQTRHGGS